MAQPAPRRIAVAAAPGSVDHLLDQLDLPPRTTTLVINGGTSDDRDFPVDSITAALRTVIVELRLHEGPVIISGGTDAGLFGLLGDVVGELGLDGPMIGVVPAGKISRPNGTPLEAHHSHVLMVDGAAWGDETPTMLALCRELARRGPVVALVAGGGAHTLIEIDGHRVDHRPVIILTGTGRLADDLARQIPRPAGLIFVEVSDLVALATTTVDALGPP
jgi:hypothetical protein